MSDVSIAKSKGKIPKWLLIFGGLLVLFIIIVAVGGEKKPTVSPTSEGREVVKEKPPLLGVEKFKGKPVFRVGEETMVGENLVVKVIKVKDKGSVLKASESQLPEWSKDVTTKGKFIMVTFEAKNVGKETDSFSPPAMIYDNREREFSWFSSSDWSPGFETDCDELQPGFSPKQCGGIYEVAKDSTGLKVPLREFFGLEEVGYVDLGI